MEKPMGFVRSIKMNVYSIADNIISPLGCTTAQNFEAALQGESGIAEVQDQTLYPERFFGAKINPVKVPDILPIKKQQYTFLEQLFIYSIQTVLSQITSFDKSRTLLILSTTKGNISLLDEAEYNNFPANRVEIPAMAQAINDYFTLPNVPLVVSNACISGVSAILTAKKLIQMGLCDHVIVSGGDVLSEFIISGFHALMAISDTPCKPYDADRAGITLGEACSTMFITNNPALCTHEKAMVKIRGGGQSNDANHISGPSRTGAGLKLAVDKAMTSAAIAHEELAYINAHGTATIFNDEMEAVAFDALGMNEIPLNSLKGYFGHTLGGAGLVESVLTIRQMKEGTLLASRGYHTSGVSKQLKVLDKNKTIMPPKYALKTVSGFGGCNAAIIFENVCN
jgi:3-oxoacyl-[acyl-carrier-protein] synthase I